MLSARTACRLSVLLLCSIPLAACRERSTHSALLHAERTFVVQLDAPFARVVPLFGPIGERQWAPDWDPRLIFPADGSLPAKGSVFTIEGRHGDQVWVLTAYDIQRGLISYLVVDPGLLVTEIEIQVKSAGENSSRAEVTYRDTALSPKGNHMVQFMTENIGTHSAHWERAIREALKRQRKNVAR